MRKTGSIIILLLLLFQLLMIFVPPATQTSKAWWNTDWAHYKVCYINTNGYSGYYQMKLNVSYNGGGDVSCEGHCQADFDDIRFVDIDNTTVLPYWKETYVDSQYAIFWINVSADAIGDGKILMYYGNSEAADASDGDETFIFFDDFEGELDSNKWNTIQGSISTSNGKLRLEGTSGTRGLIESKITFSIGAAVEVYAKANNENQKSQHICSMRKPGDGNYRAGDAYGRTYHEDMGFETWNAGSYTQTLSIPATFSDAWHHYKVTWREGNSKFYIDDVEKASHTTNIPTVDMAVIFYEGETSGDVFEVDWVLVRKYAEPEPVWSGFSAEQQQSGNHAPSISNPQPSNGETNVPITLSQLSITINDADGDIMNITWQENSSGTWKTFNTTTNVGNGTYYAYNTSWISEQDKKYWWRVCVNDGSSWTNVTYSFTTGIAIFNISVPQSDIDNYGLQYPVTYKFSIPSGMTGLKCYKRNSTNSEWWQLPEKTSKNATSPTTLYNGIEVVRFDYGNNTAYVSVGFTAGKNYMHIKFTDSEGSLLYNCSYESITTYYDNRKAAVVITWDDWNNYYDDDFVEACNIAQARNLWATVGVITHNFTDDTPLSSTVWQHIQNEVDEGCVEVASHSRTHPDIPYDDYDSEINGSKQDILNNLTLPYGQYVYTYIYPFGHEDSTAESKCGQYHYLISRDTYTGSSPTDFSSWSDTYNKYAESKPDKRMGSDGTTSLSELNSAFDSAYSSGGIYHVMSHPYKVDWDSYGKAHFDYIANHTDIWYVGYGLLYMYHYVEDRDIVTVTAAPLSEINSPPQFSNENPPNGSANQPLSLTWSVDINDPEGDTFNWTIECSNGQSASGTNDVNGTKSLSLTGLSYNTNYTIWVNATDSGSGEWTRATYWFITASNSLPVQSNPSPSNGATDVPVSLSQLTIDISDPEGDLMDWSIETSPDIGSASGNNAGNGTITCPVSGLSYNTTYTWYVNVTDGNSWNNQSYAFTTRDQYIPDPPSSFTATAVSSSQIDLSWNKGAKADTTYIERNTVSSWNRGEGTLIYNGTGTSYSDTGLSSGTTYYYQAWSYNATDNVYSSTYSSASATTTGSATVVTNESTGVEETNATLRGYLEDDGGENCSVGFDYGYTTSYGNWVLVDPSANTGEEFSYPLISIYPGTVYHYRATASNSNGTVYGADKMFLTKPYEPTSLTATSDSEDSISLSWTKGNGADKTVIVRKTGSYPTSITDGTVVYNDTGTSYTDTGLSAGTDYYYRAWSYVEDSGLHQYSDGYASAMNYTYPNKPTSVSSSATPTSITLSWTKGNGADYTVIRYSTSGYPSSLSEGTLAYNGTGTSTTISGLTPDTTYYFSFWAYDSESGYYSQEYTTHTATTPYVPPDPSNLVATTVNDTKISLTWSASTDVNSVLVRKVGNYPSSPSDGTVIFNSSGTSYVDTGLTPSTHYYYRVWTYNQGVYSENYAEDDAWTYPQPPQDVDYTLESSGTTANLTITWTKGQGADKTVIRKSANSFPSSPSDGILVYNGTGESYTDANIDQMWYYRLWSYNEESGLYSEGVNLTFFACWLNCYNETTGEAISNWSVFISDMNGSQVYTAENLQNSHILNSSQLPQGLVSFKFTADGYKFRLYYYEITSEKSLTINAYLPPESANLYMLYVKDVFGSPVRGALISVRHYNPASDTYVEVARLYTDAEGRAGVYLVPGDMYKIVISKEGYQTGHSDFTPLAELYTAEFTLLGSGEGGELPEGLWDNITLSIRPSQTHFNESTNLTVYFNISCPTGEIEWYKIEVYRIRNLTQTETLLYSYNESNPYGGNLSYNIGSEVGTYKVVCTFKKQNFSAVSFERDYYIYEEKLPSMSIIPPHVYVIILIFLALAAMAFLMRLGAGDLSPIAGIIVFIIGFLIYPVTIAGVSCWFMVAAMGIGYGAYMFIRSGV